MFDPTAFDNLKTVLEGTIYDRDLDGTISITNRSDLIDVATLNRTFIITFTSANNSIEAEMQLYADLKKLAIELLPEASQEEYPGAAISLTFRKEGLKWSKNEQEVFSKQWGEHRCHEWRQITSNRHPAVCEMAIHFDRTITEEMFRDVEDMVYFTIETIDMLGKAANG
ncbi:hypothetical protein KP78_31020 [Jeotgalibacillus soli]|uniref:Group-specific protein n=1 Tax=Jeotgalibacillus soli TaxID=889306 RepID=A0A0C2VJG4_9BACL|nr:hypothetical protein KP78_31020 [Jeotgalibacillus soli]